MVVGSVVLLAGCAAESSQFVGVTASPSTSASVTASPSPSPSSEVEDLSDAGLGIVFEDVPTDLTGDEADVYNTVAIYQSAYWRTMTTNTVSPVFSVIGSAEIKAIMRDTAEGNTAIDATIAGEFRTRVTDVVVDGDQATAVTCDDYEAVTFADAERSYTPAEAGFADVRRKEMTLQRVEGQDLWLVQMRTVDGTC
ncbi:hypothetical protein [Cellulomonas sp. SLBN-39]|uniref:hypothetical protein n=1 Tax=Cellulomonas sp. SLBN-39 TaxID=2768446 RepID=UPI0013592469|nr:hypothetical protein [Cellulomonas sp. SLBN-39]